MQQMARIESEDFSSMLHLITYLKQMNSDTYRMSAILSPRFQTLIDGSVGVKDIEPFRVFLFEGYGHWYSLINHRLCYMFFLTKQRNGDKLTCDLYLRQKAYNDIFALSWDGFCQTKLCICLCFEYVLPQN